ncbi:Ig-like domain-containing protein [Campylobacter concisus]|uniref:Ig-like domain-containing protein n=1 Tax=Campylobacter concisus TaxID=199 RepID=UPI0011E8228C|nr:Ig-like domain-containing protein [Campylobacter concisus]
MSKVKGLIKSIIGTDAIVAVDANGNQRTLKAGDVIYDNEVIKEQDGVKVEVQSLNSENENASDETGKEVASLQEQLLNGKNISDLEETAAGGNASAGGSNSGDGVSLGAASFAQGGHYSNINANFENLSSQANASAEAFTNVSGGASEEGFSLDTLAAAIDNAYNNILPQPLEVSVTAVDDNVVTGNTDESVSRPIDILPQPLEVTVTAVDDNVVTGNTDESVSHHIDVGDNILEHNVSERTGLHITNDNTPTLVGKATSNATISIFDGEGENAPLLGTTTADNDGNWSYTPTSPLADGDHKFTIEASKVAANGEELKATSTQEITVDTVNNQLSIDSIKVDRFGDLRDFHMFRLPDSITSHIDDSTLINSMNELDWTPTITGKAEAFADVNLEIWMKPALWEPLNTPDKFLTTISVKADENGNWKAEDIDFKGKAYFDQGYEIKVASSVDEAGNVADLSTPTTFYFPVPTPPEDHL